MTSETTATTDDIVTIRVRIHGRVQGVGYRYWTVQQALATANRQVTGMAGRAGSDDTSVGTRIDRWNGGRHGGPGQRAGIVVTEQPQGNQQQGGDDRTDARGNGTKRRRLCDVIGLAGPGDLRRGSARGTGLCLLVRL